MEYGPAELIDRIDHLELEAKQVVEGYLAGRHRSPRFGFAVEFAQHREYTPGDDIRHIDWKVYARTERFQLKQFEQETNLVAWLLVDSSESMTVSTHQSSDGKPVTKYDVARTIAAALAYLITQQADSVGLATLADRPRISLRASGSGSQFRDILRLLVDGPSQLPTDVGRAVRDLSSQLGRRGIIFVFSDFLDELPALATGLRVLRSHKHEVVLFQILDPAEIDFPFRHPTLFQGLERLPEISTDPLSVRENYLREFGKHQQELGKLCRGLEVDLVQLRTDADLGRELTTYLRRRSGK